MRIESISLLFALEPSSEIIKILEIERKYWIYGTAILYNRWKRSSVLLH